MTAKQIMFFGTKRQRAALKHRKRRNAGRAKVRHDTSWLSSLQMPKKGSFKGSRFSTQPHKRRKRRKPSVASFFNRGKKRNVGKVITITNKGRRKRYVARKRRSYTKRRVNPTMAHRKSAKRVAAGRKAARTRRRRGNPGVRRRRSYSVRRHRNPVYRRRNRRRVSNRRHVRRHRNPGMLSGSLGRVVGVVGGATLTKLLVGFVPAQFTSGFLGYIAIGLVATLQGKLVAKVSHNGSLGADFTIGGYTYLAIKMLNDFLPSLGGSLGLSGGRGMGLIAPSSFYVPQVNRMGSMGNFVVPAAIPAPVVVSSGSGMHGVGTMRRTGRVR